MDGVGKAENKISHQLAVTVIYGAGNKEAGVRVQQEPGMRLHKHRRGRGLQSLIQTRHHANPQAHLLKPQPPRESEFGSFLHPHQLHPKPCFNVGANFQADPSRCSPAWIPKAARKPQRRAANCGCQRVTLLLHGYGYIPAESSTLPQSPIPLYPPLLPPLPSSTTPRAQLIPFPSFPHTPNTRKAAAAARGEPIFLGLGPCSHEAFCFPKRLPRSLNFDPPAVLAPQMFMKLEQAGSNAQLGWPPARLPAAPLGTATGREALTCKETCQGSPPRYLHSTSDLPAQPTSCSP